ncbi:hypothetical protein BN903_2 [Halorubrum sp. AJ67]|nr:hypothetical protein BN903_2 [Halorubrum sp. AJ67]
MKRATRCVVRESEALSSSRKALRAFRTTASVCPPRDWGFGGVRVDQPFISRNTVVQPSG